MAHVSHKLSNSFQGALAGGGDPATSPLYVFGPFLKLLVLAGAVTVSFGASIWLAVFTVVMVSVVYRFVMIWVTDGSGGSGLSEEEFGSWAVGINAGVTVIEYILTFLVSIAALVTFVADRFPVLGQAFLGIQWRTFIAILLSLGIGWVVNRGPKAAALAFGPATAAVLLLLWVMVIATIVQRGFHLPDFQPAAFSLDNLHFTLGGYARILALMTGIEIFANLVAAYEGSAREKSGKAFTSLLIIMGTTCITMLVVGPAIRDLADPLNAQVSVFTQAMDALLPPPLPYLGTLIGVAVLLSAAAASAQGIQNLAVGLRYRHYLPAAFALRNRFEVSYQPIRLMIAIVILAFLLFGTHEETFLALYAAGVFILLSISSWAAVKRLTRKVRADFEWRKLVYVVGFSLAALLTSGATIIIFEERISEGAWMYFVLVPILYAVFAHYRKRLGEPGQIENRLGLLIASSNLPQIQSESIYTGVTFKRVLVPLDQSSFAEQSLTIARYVSRSFNSGIHLLTVLEEKQKRSVAENYLLQISSELIADGHETTHEVVEGVPAEKIVARACDGETELVTLNTHSRPSLKRWLSTSTSSRVIYRTTPPLLLIRSTEDWRSMRTRFKKLIVALDGSSVAEQILPYARSIGEHFNSEVVLLSVPDGAHTDTLGDALAAYLDRIKADLTSKGLSVRTLLTGSVPWHTIVGTARDEEADLIMMVSHGRGGIQRQEHVKVGSVTDQVLQETPCPLFLVSARSDPGK